MLMDARYVCWFSMIQNLEVALCSGTIKIPKEIIEDEDTTAR